MDARQDSILDRFLRTEMAILVFAIVLAMFPYTRDPTGDIKILLYAVGGGILAGVCVIGRLKTGRPLRRPRVFLVPMLVLFGLLAVSGLRSGYLGNSLVALAQFAALFLLYLVASQAYHTPGQIQRLMLVTCAAVSVSVAYGIIQYFGLDPFPWNPEQTELLKEAPGTFGNGNLAAHTTVLCIAMAVYLAVARKNVLSLGFVLLFLVHLHLANQRGGVLGLGVSAVLIVVAALVHRRVKRPMLTIAISLAIVGLMGVLGAAGLMGYTKLRTGVYHPHGLPILLRYHGYSGASQMIMEKPLLGYGPRNYRILNPKWWTPFEQEHFVVKHKMNYNAHNDVLEMGVDAGLPAAGLYLAILVAAIAYGLLIALTEDDPGKRRIGYALAAIFCTFMIDGFFGFNLRVPVSASLIFIMAGCLEAIRLPPERPCPDEKPGRAAWALTVLVVLVAVAAALFQVRVFASSYMLQRARGAIHWKAYDDAKRILARGEVLAPWNWEFASSLGQIAIKQFDAPAAIAHFERALTRNPTDVTVMTELARAKIMLAEIGAADKPLDVRLDFLAQAEAHAREALEICPPFPRGEDLLGRAASVRAVLLKQEAERGADVGPRVTEAWREAETHFERAVKFSPKANGRLYMVLAVARVELEDETGAQDAFIRAAAAAPANADVWPVFYRFARDSGRMHVFREAVAKADKRLRAQEDDLPPALEAVLIAWSGQPDAMAKAAGLLAEAAKAERVAQTARPRKSKVIWAARLLVDELRKRASSVADAALPAYRIGLAYTAAGETEAACALFATCWQHLPRTQQTECLIVWAELLNRQRQYAKSVTILREAVSRLSGDPNLQLALARSLALNGNVAEARNEYALMLDLFPLKDTERQAILKEMDALKAKGD